MAWFSLRTSLQYLSNLSANLTLSISKSPLRYKIDLLTDLNAGKSEATKNRSIGATNLNRASSRSHAILTIEIMMNDPTEHRSESTRETSVRPRTHL